MPNRILREGILNSDRVEHLDFAAEVFYRRLMSKVDDHGLFDARPSILRTSLYPLRVDRVREADISRWIAMCEKAGVIALYEHGGKPYLQMLDTRWQVRSEAKYPLPPANDGSHLRTSGNSCTQPLTTAHLVGDVVGDDKEPTVLVDDKSSTPDEPIPIDRVDCPMQGIADAWNAVAVSMPAVKPVAEWADARKRMVKARWVDKLKLKKYSDKTTGIDYWTRLFARVESSDFLAGRGGGTFTATLDWVMNPTNLAKIIENGYPNRQAVPA